MHKFLELPFCTGNQLTWIDIVSFANRVEDLAKGRGEFDNKLDRELFSW